MKNGIELVRTSSTVGEINLYLQLIPAEKNKHKPKTGKKQIARTNQICKK